MLVKMKVQTRYLGKGLNIDEEIDVEEETAFRWHNSNIAEMVTVQKPEPIKYEDMSEKDLFKLCIEREIDAEKKKDKAYYISLLVENDAKVAE